MKIDPYVHSNSIGHWDTVKDKDNGSYDTGYNGSGKIAILIRN